MKRTGNDRRSYKKQLTKLCPTKLSDSVPERPCIVNCRGIILSNLNTCPTTIFATRRNAVGHVQVQHNNAVYF